jgi:hypothetical protein
MSFKRFSWLHLIAAGGLLLVIFTPVLVASHLSLSSLSIIQTEAKLDRRLIPAYLSLISTNKSLEDVYPKYKDVVSYTEFKETFKDYQKDRETLKNNFKKGRDITLSNLFPLYAIALYPKNA